MSRIPLYTTDHRNSFYSLSSRNDSCLALERFLGRAKYVLTYRRDFLHMVVNIYYQRLQLGFQKLYKLSPAVFQKSIASPVIFLVAEELARVDFLVELVLTNYSPLDISNEVLMIRSHTA